MEILVNTTDLKQFITVNNKIQTKLCFQIMLYFHSAYHKMDDKKLFRLHKMICMHIKRLDEADDRKSRFACIGFIMGPVTNGLNAFGIPMCKSRTTSFI